MSDAGGHEAWAREEFGGAMLRDVRHVRRLQAMAADLASCPAGSVPGAFRRPRSVRAAYEFLEHGDVDWRDIAAASHRACAGRCAEHSTVIVPVDGSSWSFTDRRRCKGLGPIGSRQQGAQGVKAMTAYALDFAGVPLGVLAQALWVRSQVPHPVDCAQRSLEEKESRWWTHLQTSCEQQFLGRSAPPRLWYQMDREADQVPVLLRATEPGVLLTVRADHNRVLAAQTTQDEHGPLKVLELLEHEPVRGHAPVRVARSRNGKRTGKARTALVSVRFTHVSLRLRARWSHRFVADAPVTVVHVREVGSPDEDPIEWVLYTTYPVRGLNDALLVVRAYALRWRIERMHYTTKTGAAHLHDSQLRSFEALAKWITLTVAVASRLQHILHRSREEPDAPAETEFSRDEIEATLLLREKEHGKVYPAGRGPTLGEIVLFVAMLGGYLGHHSSGGPPGVKVFERGFLRVETASLTLAALQDRARARGTTDGSNA
jgi:Transposase DNA-binding/Transposase DDE domain